MATSPTQEGVHSSWQCATCQARVASTAVGAVCPLCGGALRDEAGAAPTLAGSVIPVRYDRQAFARAVLAFLATCADVPDEIVASVAVPEALVPLHIPFRRTRTLSPACSSAGLHAAPLRGTCQVDVCMASGLDAREATALEAIVAGYASADFSTGTPSGPVLLGDGTETAGADAAQSGHAPPSLDDLHYLSRSG